MRKSLSLIVIAFFMIACSSTFSVVNTQIPPTAIPATATPPVDGFSMNGQLQGTLAFIRNNNLWINVNGVESQLTNDADPSLTGLPKLWYSNPQISPDGSQIAFLKMTETNARTLMVSDIDGGNLRQLASDVAWTLPTIAWSNDNQKIYYASSIDPVENMIAKSIDLLTGELQEQGQFSVHSGCGGGSSDPADSISSLESLAPFGRHVFSLAPQNNYILHSTICSGSGLGMLDLSTNLDQVLDDRAYGAVISPDGSRIAAVSDNNIIIFNVSIRSIESIFPTSDTPQSLLWVSDGNEVLYSTSRLTNTLTLDDNLALNVFGSSPASFKVNTSTLWLISLENGQSSKVLDLEAHNLKPIATNGQKALVVMIENADKLFNYVNQGNSDNLAGYYPTSNLIEVDLANSSSNPVTNNTQQASYFK